MKRLLWTLTIGVAMLAPLIATTRVFADPAPASPAAAGSRVAGINNTRVGPTPTPVRDFARPGDDRAGAVALTARLPDLTVRAWYSDRGEPWVWVINQGSGDAGPSRVAVLAGAQSFPFQLEFLGAGGQFWHRLPADLECERTVTFIVDVWSQVRESNEENNTFPFTVDCQIKRRLSS